MNYKNSNQQKKSLMERICKTFKPVKTNVIVPSVISFGLFTATYFLADYGAQLIKQKEELSKTAIFQEYKSTKDQIYNLDRYLHPYGEFRGYLIMHQDEELKARHTLDSLENKLNNLKETPEIKKEEKIPDTPLYLLCIFPLFFGGLSGSIAKANYIDNQEKINCKKLNKD